MSSATNSKTNQIRNGFDQKRLRPGPDLVAADGDLLNLYHIRASYQLPGAVAEKIETPGTWNCKTENFNMPC